jgi:hypothetical protein
MQDETESLKNNQQDIKPAKGKNGGARPGAGRPKGKLSKLNEQRQKAKKRFIERVNKMVDELFNAQASIAQGVSYLYRIDKDDKGHDKPAVIETDPNVIKDYIDGKLEDSDSYYYITTERPDTERVGPNAWPGPDSLRAYGSTICATRETRWRPRRGRAHVS